MLQCFWHKNCEDCDSLRQTLEELSLSHTNAEVERDSQIEDLPAEPPVIIDEGQVIQGTQKILEHIEKLKNFSELWYKYQSDVCYCDEDAPE